MTEDLSKRVQQAASGVTPQTKPDERRRYLGSLRERVLLRMTVAQVADPKLDTLFLKNIDDFKGYTVLINGKMPQNDFISKLMGKCSQDDIKFTLINDETAKNEPDATGILVVSKTAINRYRIDIQQVYAPTVTPNAIQEPKKKKSFWSKLFNRGK
ncbi:YueI family protein [uncultured Lactobacillus sp.]|uniref:YueI family protein n=1 Tax=uncultured Lactobacillus sp. TaxID=153152 RepID=UPI00262524C2|nr:YueI family protein [uncultured Lactobacillus sp.]